MHDASRAGVFGMPDALERHLAGNAFLIRDRLPEADLRLFVTLARFDFARRRRPLAIPAVREAVDIDHIKRGSYSIKALNPTGVVPPGPPLDGLIDRPSSGELRARR